jgi:hypothetical protein
MKHILFFLLIALWLTACLPTPVSSTGASTPKTPQALQPTAASTALFQIIKADGTNVGVTVEDLKTLPLAQVEMDGKVEEGPRLLDVLTLAGVTDFSEVILTGSSNPATLTREQVDDHTILDFTNHGTVKLATIYVPKPNWTKDVSTIEVKG